MTSAPDSIWTPIRRSNLSDDITDRLITSVLNGAFKFGEKLPPERDLARQLEVGRPTVREAIRALSVIGLVDVRPGEGTFIANRHSDFVAKAFSWAMLMDVTTAREVIEARTAIEVELALLAATRAQPEHIAELKRLVSLMAKATDAATTIEADFQFHLELAGSAESPALYRLLEALHTVIKQWIDVAERSSVSTHADAVRQHRKIIHAIERHDADAARRAMRMHLEDMGHRLISAIDGRSVTDI